MTIEKSKQAATQSQAEAGASRTGSGPGGAQAARITVSRNGPYLVEGAVPLANQTIESDSEGGSREWLQGQPFEVTEVYRLCRCGQSSNKPFCDSTHLKVGFDGTETASTAP